MLMGYWFDNSTFKFNGKYVGIISGYNPLILSTVLSKTYYENVKTYHLLYGEGLLSKEYYYNSIDSKSNNNVVLSKTYGLKKE